MLFRSGRLFAEVRGVAGDPGQTASPAVTTLVFPSINPASSGADLAGIQHQYSFQGSFLQDFGGHEVVARQENTFLKRLNVTTPDNISDQSSDEDHAGLETNLTVPVHRTT